MAGAGTGETGEEAKEEGAGVRQKQRKAVQVLSARGGRFVVGGNWLPEHGTKKQGRSLKAETSGLRVTVQEGHCV